MLPDCNNKLLRVGNMLDEDARGRATHRSVAPVDVVVNFGRIHEFDKDGLLSGNIGDVPDVAERKEPSVVATGAARPSGADVVNPVPGEV